MEVPDRVPPRRAAGEPRQSKNSENKFHFPSKFEKNISRLRCRPRPRPLRDLLPVLVVELVDAEAAVGVVSGHVVGDAAAGDAEGAAH